ncbi:hypothetical protein KKF38_03550 [Patescibacteria group bacterium]|nr:hypothetical protein [Patescibacteria group bacterium]
MSFFSKKREVCLEDFCRDFYENLIFGQKIKELAKEAKDAIVKVDDAFAVVDLQKLTYEFTIIGFELFAVAWAHHFEDSLVSQSIFTKKYLTEKKKDDIWDGMKKYYLAVQSSKTYDVSAIKNISIAKDWVEYCDKEKKILSKNGIILSESVLENVYRSSWRRKSKKAWKTGATIFGIRLALCERLGLAEGDDSTHFGRFTFDDSNINFGINTNAQFRLSAFINWLYDEAEQSLSKIEIKK